MGDSSRVAAIWSEITACAEREHARVTLRHVCLACVQHLDVDAAAVSLAGRSPRLRQATVASDPLGDELEELQATLGEGPGMDALNEDGLVLVEDLTSAGSSGRWPVFAPAAAQRGVRAMFAVPIVSGAVSLGVIDLYRTRSGTLTGDQLDSAFAYADAALVLALEGGNGEGAPAKETIDELFTERRVEVHQATGMISVQLGLNVTDALARLRAHAYATDSRLSDVAAEVVARRLRFTADGPGTRSAPAVGDGATSEDSDVSPGNGGPADSGDRPKRACGPQPEGQEDRRKDGA